MLGNLEKSIEIPILNNPIIHPRISASLFRINLSILMLMMIHTVFVIGHTSG